MRKRLSNDSPISDILKEIIQTHHLEKGLNEVSVINAWKKLMGNGVNTYTKNILVKGNTLYVELSSAVLREELAHGKSKIIALINEELGQEIIKEVILR